MDATALRAVFEAVATPQVVLNRDGIVLLASQAYLRSTSSTREAVIGRPLAQLSPYARCEPAQRELASALEVTLRSGVRHAVLLEGAAPTASGTRFTSASLTPIAAPDGSVTYLLHAFEPEGRAPGPAGGERRLRKMIEDSYETIGLVDERGLFTFVCGIERVLGFSEQEWLALPALETIHPDDVAGFGAEINRMFGKTGGRFMKRVRSRHKDGSYRMLEASAVNRLDDPDVAAVVITFRDVTAQIAMQEETRRSEERLRIALSAARALCWDIDFASNSHTFSEDYSAYYGLPAGTYDGNDTLEAVHPDDRAKVVSAAMHTRDAGGEFSVEFRGLPRAEGTRWYASHGKPFHDEQGKPVRMLGVTWEISERRRMEEERRLLEERLQQSQKLESLGVLAGGIAHDFNNLLMAVLGNASLLEDRYPQDADARRCLSQIEEATRRASDLCRQLLAYAGKGEFVLSSVDLNSLIESTTHLLHVSISKKVLLRFDLQRDLPRIQADLTQLRQVLMNLVINASDAIGERSGVIAIRTGLMTADRAYLDQALLSAELKPGTFAFVEVSDTGTGMSEETISHIFEPFFSTKFPGRGLGLASVLGIVRGHRGALRVHSVLERGSTFRFLLPVTEVQPDAEAEAHKSPPAFVGEGALLLVDDEETIRVVASRMLETLGFHVLTASDGREALRVYEEHAQEFTCVIMDLTMPHLDGEEAMRALRRKNPAQRVLLISGYNPQDSVNRLLSPGLTGFLQKPFNMGELTSALHGLLG